MNIYLTVRDSQIALYRYHQVIQEVDFFLEKHPQRQKTRHIRKLVELVLFPDSFLLTLPPPLLVTLFEDFFDFLQQRDGDTAVRFEPLPASGGGLLLVSCPSAPHIVDSILALQQQFKSGFEILAHPLLVIARQGQEIVQIADPTQRGSRELFVLLRVEEVSEDVRHEIEDSVLAILHSALRVRRDRSAMLERLLSLELAPEMAEWSAFLAWVRAGAFMPLLYRSWVVDDRANADTGRDGLRLGISAEDCRNCGSGMADEEQLTRFLVRRGEGEGRALLTIHPSPLICPLLRQESMLTLVVREGLGPARWRIHGFFGLFVRSEMEGAASKVPALDWKIRQLLKQLRLSPDSHDFHKLKELFDLFPKVELFFMGETQLGLIARSLMHYLQRPDTLKLLILASPNPAGLACLIIIPQALYRHALDLELQEFLCRSLPVTVAKARLIHTGGGYVGLHLLFRGEAEEICIDINPLERALTRLAQPWEMKVRRLLGRAFGRERSTTLWRQFARGFGPEYRSLLPPRFALRDMLALERLEKGADQVIELLNPGRGMAGFRLHFYSREPVFLDQYMPVLENFSLRVMDQIQFTVFPNGEKYFIKSFSVSTAGEACAPLSTLRDRLLGALSAIFQHKVDNDSLNGLLIKTGLDWKEIDVLRAYRNYYFQLGGPASSSSFHRALLGNPKAAHLLFRYFEARFRPSADWSDIERREVEALFPLRMKLLECMEAVTDINDDRILRTLFNLMDATVRSNYHIRRDREDFFISFKINSLGVIDMPAPRPKFEIYVHGAHLEGVHLRGGEVARGGIRWSDRVDDFRTEILGLMRTQMSKNALIVPKGAKGGFVLKAAPAESREVASEAVKQAYMTFIRALLDLTDNRLGNDPLRLPGIVAYDDFDPYLVVAADKGTAQLSDVANAVAREYDFWLKDAFASGGSQGYSHKRLGITARGAWECVKRHFRELGRDIQTEPFTVIGLGSMDGDVFGNGMLLSPCIRLVAAISGEHIFLDPAPDAERSFAERRRLFDLSGSSWNDYDPALLSEGGGVFPRSAKNIPLSPQVRAWLGVRYQSLDGEGLIRRILTAPADLLWLGGIGTYVKASHEKNEEVGDRVNDNVRVDAADVRAPVVGEGANLGFTQKARVEFNLAGGLINTDGVDNSAGVDTSDHEVNLKILMIDLQSKKLLTDYHILFERVTEEVTRQVLANNYTQSLCLSLDSGRCANRAEPFLDLADALESGGLLDRVSESFPRRKDVLARPGQRLARPELAILMAYGKMQLFQVLMESPDFLGQSYCRKFLLEYFPAEIRRLYGAHLDGHPLANEIKATVITNKIINQAGSTFLGWGASDEGNDLLDWVGAYITFDRVLEGDRLRRRVYALDNRIPAQAQYGMLLQLEGTLERLCAWAMAYNPGLRPTLETLECYGTHLPHYEAFLQQLGSEEDRARLQESSTQYVDLGFDVAEGRRMALLARLEDFPRLVELTVDGGGEFLDLAKVYEQIFLYFGLQRIQGMLEEVVEHNHWHRKVKQDLRDRIKAAACDMTAKIAPRLGRAGGDDLQPYLPVAAVASYHRFFRQITETSPPDLSPYTVLCGALEKVAEAVA